MAENKRISDFPTATNINGSEELVFVKNGVTVKGLISQVRQEYLDQIYQDKFTGNTASGVSTVTIDALSGVAEFTGNIGDGDNTLFRINNSECSENSVVISAALMYDGAGMPMLVNTKTIDGALFFTVINLVDGGNPTDNPIRISFVIYNA